ncbi:MAG: hypothetical protein ACXVNO_10455, partial [Bacteroidia bacterium]
TNKENKASIYHINFNVPTIIDNISFKVKVPNFYKRSARIFVNRTRTVKHKEENYKEVVFEFELNSNTNTSFDLFNFREKEFEIEISNEDNPPLEFEAVELKQLQTYLVADFKTNENYVLFVGDKKLKAPVYDIEYFKNKISQFIPTLEVSELKPLPPVAAELIIAPEKHFWQEPWFLWGCITIASFLLFLFSIRVLKDMKKGD